MRVIIEVDGDEHEVAIARQGETVKIEIDGEAFDARVGEGGVVTLGEHVFEIKVSEDHALIDGHRVQYRIHDVRAGGGPGEKGGARGARVKPPMPGKIVSVAVTEGQEVKQGEVLLILEAMKMQNEITSPSAGVVKKVHVKPGQNVEGKDVLVEIE